MSDENEPVYPVSREQLYALAWSEPMTAIARRFDVSSSYLARVYTLLNVPRPAPGYWAKVAVGKPVSMPSLPEATPENAGGWDRHNSLPVPAPKVARPPVPRRKPAHNSTPKSIRSDVHPLIRGTRDHFLKTRESRIGYLRPYKKQLVDLIVSKTGLSRALDVANKLFLAFEDRGYRVVWSSQLGKFQRPPVDEREKPGREDRFADHWSPDRGTITYIGDVAIGLTLFETSESVEMVYIRGEYVPVSQLNGRASRSPNLGWTAHKDCPTGRFCLRAYSPYHGTSWTHRWQISPDADLAELGYKIAKELLGYAEIVAAEATKAVAEAERQRAKWEEEKRQWAIEEERQRHREANEASRSELMHVIDKWNEQKKIGAFFTAALGALKELPADQQAQFLERIEQAREMVGAADALNALAEWKSPAEHLETIKRRSFW